MHRARYDSNAGSQRAKSSRVIWLSAIGLCLQCLGACGGSGNNQDSGSPPPPPGSAEIDGRFVGKVTIDGRDYFGDAMFNDGVAQLYIGGPYSGAQEIQLGSPEGSIHFAGTGESGSFTGRVIGREPEDCGTGAPSRRWCGRASSASIHIEAEPDADSGAIRGEIAGHGEIWTLDLTPWTSAYNQPARLGDLTGLYTELVAPFAGDGGLVVRVDPDGRTFFQGFPYLCSGNGTISPHGDGSRNVFDLEMTIDGCDYPYSLLNGEYRGLATLSPSSIRGTDSNLRVWLARFAPQSSAIVMWGARM
jgi:hypothetical protein